MTNQNISELKEYLESMFNGNIDKFDNEEEKKLYIENYNEVIKILNEGLVDIESIIKQKMDYEKNNNGNKYFIVNEADIKKIMKEREKDGEHSENREDVNIFNEETKNKFLSALSKEIHNRVNTIEKTIAESLGKVTGAFKGAKDVISGIGTFISHPIDTVKDIFNGNIFNSKEKNEEMLKIGISKKALNKTDVLNKSAVGVAVFWLATKLGLATDADKGVSGIMGAVKGGLKSLATRKLVQSGVGSMLMNFGKQALGFLLNPYVIGAVVIAVGSYLLYKWWRGQKDKLAQEYATGKTTSEVLGRQSTEQEDKRHKQLNDRYGAKQKTDKEAKEYIDKKANMKGVTAGGATAIGGLAVGLGLKALFTYTSSTFLLGGALGPAAMALASNPVGWAIAGGLAIGGLVWAGYKFFSNKEKVKKGGDQLIKEETENKEKIKTYDKFKDDFNLKMKKKKTMEAMVDNAVRTKENTAYIEDVYNIIKNSNNDGTGTPTPPSDNDTPSQGGNGGNGKPIEISGDLVKDAHAITHSQEAVSNYVNLNEGKLSAIGGLQYNWYSDGKNNGGNALRYLKEMKEKYPEIVKQYGWDSVIDRLSKNPKDNTIYENERDNFNKMMRESKEIKAFDDQKGLQRTAGYIASGRKRGITNEKALAMYADMTNFIPAGAVKSWNKDLINLSNTNPEEAIRKASDNFKGYLANYYANKGEKYIKAVQARVDRAMGMILKSDIGKKDTVAKTEKPKEQSLTDTQQQIEKEKEKESQKAQQTNLDKATQKFSAETSKKAEERKKKETVTEEENIRTKNEESFANFGTNNILGTKNIVDLVMDYQFGVRTFGEKIMNGNTEIKISSLGGGM